MNLIDSSGWIEYFRLGPNEPHFRPVIEDARTLLVPTIAICEVVRFITRTANRVEADRAAAQMERCLVIDLDAGIARLAARLGLKHNLPTADSIVYATAQAHNAKLYTQDADFEKLPGVKYVRKK
jgi:toxin FitB